MKTTVILDVSAEGGKGKVTKVEEAVLALIKDKMFIFKDEVKELLENCDYQLENIDRVKMTIDIFKINEES